MAINESLEELREMGVGGAIFRAGWELKMRTGLMTLSRPRVPMLGEEASSGWLDELPFSDPAEVAAAMRDRIPAHGLSRLSQVAAEAARGRILCFGCWSADFGHPINWNLNPTSGREWNSATHWSRVLADQADIGDVKFTWEVGRFPHAYHIARAAAFESASADEMAEALASQIEEFTAAAPFGYGVHWASSQEVVFRFIAWLFAFQGLLARTTAGAKVAETVTRSGLEMASHVEQHIGYAARAVYNNHLLFEGLGLFMAGLLFGDVSEAKKWLELGARILDEQAGRQVYEDGAYIQQSHNYHRAALQCLLMASGFAQRSNSPTPECWTAAMDRSLTFLLAHQNDVDGRLPNYGFNDGALPLILSTCDFSDFRPTLQAVSVAVRGERLYDAGPWDEEAAWLLGVGVLDAPLRPAEKKSVSFAATGYHTLRGNDPSSFAVFRCGSINDRFSQIDMLHVDIWWRGLNVLIDGGSYSYNGPSEWHNYFTRTASHNTIEIDRRDQMLHYRRFKCLYWTQAKLLEFKDDDAFALCAGEHYGYARHPGKCVHRRSVLLVKDDLWVVVDRVSGVGSHDLQLHWLCGDFPVEYSEGSGVASLETPEGRFAIKIVDGEGQPVAGDLVKGVVKPSRGWASRYYGEKIPVPSMAVHKRSELPFTFVSILGAGEPQVSVADGVWSVGSLASPFRFRIREGLIVPEIAGRQRPASA